MRIERVFCLTSAPFSKFLRFTFACQQEVSTKYLRQLPARFLALQFLARIYPFLIVSISFFSFFYSSPLLQKVLFERHHTRVQRENFPFLLKRKRERYMYKWRQNPLLCPPLAANPPRRVNTKHGRLVSVNVCIYVYLCVWDTARVRA